LPLSAFSRRFSIFTLCALPPFLVLLFAGLILSGISGLAQYHTVRFYIPLGYTILGRASGDINRDGYADLVVVLKNPYEKYKKRQRRSLFNCGGVHGDPFEDVAAGKAWFSVQHFGGSGWKWTRVITFAYNSGRRQLMLRSDRGWCFLITGLSNRSSSAVD
jgi:hypothetical protein